MFQQFVEGKQWEALSAEKMPELTRTVPRLFYFAKLSLITEEMKNVDGAAQTALGNVETLAILRGRMKELSAAASETVKLLYPNVKPDYKTDSPLNPDIFEKIEEFVQSGAIDQLNEKTIPGWDQLVTDQRLLFRLRALQVYFARWQEAEESEAFNEEQVGFTASGQRDTSKLEVKDVADLVQEKIIGRHLQLWFEEAEKSGLTADDPIVQSAQTLISETKK